MRKMTLSIAAVAGLAGLAVALPVTAAPAGDAAAGKKVFMRCAACHTVDASAAPKMGPTLAGVMNRKAATVKGGKFSPAMKKSGIVWNDKTLDTWLAKPVAMVPGTSMAFAGLSNEQQRRDLIAYLKTIK